MDRGQLSFGCVLLLKLQVEITPMRESTPEISKGIGFAFSVSRLATQGEVLLVVRRRTAQVAEFSVCHTQIP